MNRPSRIRLPLFDLDLLQTLVAIAETGNFSTAGAEVGRTPSAISMQVRKMEDLVGRQLFRRDSRSVALTRAGEALLEHARRMLALNRQAMARFVRPEIEGEVRLGAPDDVAERFMTGMLRRFADAWPGIAVRMVVENSGALIAMVARGELDLTVITAEAGFENDAGAEIIHREPLVWAMLADGLAVEQDPLPVAVWEPSCAWRQPVLAALDAAGRSHRIAFESGHLSGQRAAILADLAVAKIPVSALGGRIVRVGAEAGLPPLPDYCLGLVCRDDPPPPVAVAAAHLRACFAGEG